MRCGGCMSGWRCPLFCLALRLLLSALLLLLGMLLLHLLGA